MKKGAEDREVYKKGDFVEPKTQSNQPNWWCQIVKSSVPNKKNQSNSEPKCSRERDCYRTKGGLLGIETPSPRLVQTHSNSNGKGSSNRHQTRLVVQLRALQGLIEAVDEWRQPILKQRHSIQSDADDDQNGIGLHSPLKQASTKERERQRRILRSGPQPNLSWS